MKRWWLVAGLLLVACAVAAPAQVTLPGYVRDDIELISQQSLPTWSAHWTGPIEAATILAWLADHGYGLFIHDYNGDGVADVHVVGLEDDAFVFGAGVGGLGVGHESEGNEPRKRSSRRDEAPRPAQFTTEHAKGTRGRGR